MIRIIFNDTIFTDENNLAITIPKGSYAAVIKIVTDYKFLWLSMDGVKEKSIVYIPNRIYNFTVPYDKQLCAYKEGTFDEDIVFSVSSVTYDELKQRRNLALNPFDMQLESEINPYDSEQFVNPEGSLAVEKLEVEAYPHIYGNRITRHEGGFYAKNVIDGIATKGGHGNYPFHSWGTSQCDDACITVYFGREVLIDTVSLALRSDYNLMENGYEHDTYWISGTIELSNGKKITIHPKKTGDYQDFVFEPSIVTWVRLKNLVPQNKISFAALNQIKILGTEI